MRYLIFLGLMACQSRESAYESFCLKLELCWPITKPYHDKCVLQGVTNDHGTNQESRTLERVINGTCEDAADVMLEQGIDMKALEN